MEEKVNHKQDGKPGVLIHFENASQSQSVKARLTGSTLSPVTACLGRHFRNISKKANAQGWFSERRKVDLYGVTLLRWFGREDPDSEILGLMDHHSRPCHSLYARILLSTTCFKNNKQSVSHKDVWKIPILPFYSLFSLVRRCIDSHETIGRAVV